MPFIRSTAIFAILLTFFYAATAYSQENAAFREREKSKPREIHVDLLPTLSIPTARLGEQGKAGIGIQIRGFRTLEDKQTGSTLAIALIASWSSHTPKVEQLSSFTVLSLSPELILLLPSPTEVTPYLSLSGGLGMISRSDDKGTNSVDYSFSEVSPVGSVGAGIRTAVKKSSLVTELRYRLFSSKLLGRSGLLSVSVGVGF